MLFTHIKALQRIKLDVPHRICCTVVYHTSSVASFGPSRSGSNNSKFKVSGAISSDFLFTIALSVHEGLATAVVGVFGPALTVETGVFGFVVVVFAVEITAWGVCGLETIGIGVGTWPMCAAGLMAGFSPGKLKKNSQKVKKKKNNPV